MQEKIVVDPVDSTRSSSGVSEQIYDNVRRSIILGDIPSGTRLTEQRLAEALGVSRVPLREALPRLEAHGFITTIKHRSATVTGWSKARVMDLFDLRLAIEPEAVRLSTNAVRTGASTGRVQRAIEEAEEAAGTKTRLQHAELLSLVYTRFTELTGNEVLPRLMDSLSQQLTWLLYLSPLKDSAGAYSDLRDVLAAVQAGDGLLAHATMYRHIALQRFPAVDEIEARTAHIPDSWSR